MGDKNPVARLHLARRSIATAVVELDKATSELTTACAEVEAHLGIPPFEQSTIGDAIAERELGDVKERLGKLEAKRRRPSK